MTCTCLALFDGEQSFCEAVTEYQVVFHDDSATNQKKIVIEWLRHFRYESNKKTYHIRFILGNDHIPDDYAELRDGKICMSALMDLLVKGRRFWYDCKRHHNNNTIPCHKLLGKPSNRKKKFDELFDNDLMSHFDEISKEAEPIATRYVREITGETTLRDKQDDLVYLPPFFTVRKCYGRFCLEKRNVIITTNNKGNIQKSPAIPGEELMKVLSWSAYRLFWKKNYPNLKVRKPTQDSCNYCYQIYNGHKFRNNNTEK